MHSVNNQFSNLRGAAACDNNCYQVLADVGLNLFRRPLTAEELARYQQYFNNADLQTSVDDNDKEKLGNLQAMQLALKAMLTSPNFLFRSELGMTASEFAEYSAQAEPVYSQMGTVTEYGPEVFKKYHLVALNRSMVSYLTM